MRSWFRGFFLSLGLAPIFVFGQGGPPGGNVTKIVRFDSDPSLFFAASNAGVLRSTDGGLGWSEQNEGLLTLNVITVAAQSPALVYAGTNGAGVFRSRDGGAWEQVSNGIESPVILSLAVHPADENTVYAGTRNGGIFKTTDAGDQWTAVTEGLARTEDGFLEGDYRDFAIDPNDPEIVYVSHGSLRQPTVGFLFKTLDGGQHWVGSQGPATFSVALSPEDSQVLYLGTSVGLIRSTNGGQFFDAPLLPTTIVDVETAAGGEVYALSRFSAAAKSFDGGDTFFPASFGLPRTEFLTMTVVPGDPAVLFLGANGPGILRSPDAGESWAQSSDGFNAADVRALSVNPADSSIVMASTAAGGMFRSTDGGASWRESRENLTAFNVSQLEFAPGAESLVYAGGVNPFDPNAGNPFIPPDGSFARSTDGGTSWEELVRAGVAAMAVHPSDGRTLFLALETGVFRSQDRSENFEPRGGNDLFRLSIVDLAIDPRRPDRLYAIVVDNFGFFGRTYFIARSGDAGDDWNFPGGGQGSFIPLVSIAVDPTHSDRIYVGAQGGFFRSNNRGGDFDDKNNGLPGDGAVIVSEIVTDARDGGTLYIIASGQIDCDGVVFKSNNRGDSWRLAHSGMERFRVCSLEVDPGQSGVLYAGTSAGGVFKTVNGGDSWEPVGATSAGKPFIFSGGIVGGADFTGGGVAPGEIVSIFGAHMGPLKGDTTEFDVQTGRLPTTFLGTTVFFGDIAAPLFFVRGNQINAQVPYEVSGAASVNVRIVAEGGEGNTVSVPVVASNPGVFTARNQDFSRNSSGNPEAPGRFLLLFVTGQGLVQPEIATGAPGPFAPPFPAPTQSVSVSIGGTESPRVASVLAPGFVGLLQVNAQIPMDAESGAHDVLVTIGDQTSAEPVTVFVE